MFRPFLGSTSYKPAEAESFESSKPEPTKQKPTNSNQYKGVFLNYGLTLAENYGGGHLNVTASDGKFSFMPGLCFGPGYRSFNTEVRYSPFSLGEKKELIMRPYAAGKVSHGFYDEPYGVTKSKSEFTFGLGARFNILDFLFIESTQRIDKDFKVTSEIGLGLEF